MSICLKSYPDVLIGFPWKSWHNWVRQLFSWIGGLEEEVSRDNSIFRESMTQRSPMTTTLIRRGEGGSEKIVSASVLYADDEPYEHLLMMLLQRLIQIQIDSNSNNLLLHLKWVKPALWELIESVALWFGVDAWNLVIKRWIVTTSLVEDTMDFL